MSLRNPIIPGSTQIKATALIDGWRLTWKVDHPLDGVPLPYVTLTGKGYLAHDLHMLLMEWQGVDTFFWHDRDKTEYTFDFNPETSLVSPSSLFHNLLGVLRNVLLPTQETTFRS